MDAGRPELMRVALSVDALGPKLSGIGRYCWELASLLPQMDEIDSLITFRGREIVADPAALLVKRKSPFPGGIFRRKISHWISRSALERARRGCLIHGPNYFLPEWADSGVITVHDLSVFRFPETHPVERVKAFEQHFSRSMNKAAHILTDSETVRDEVIAFTGISPSRITAVHLGVRPEYRPHSESEVQSARQRLLLPAEGYGLCVSTIEPRKRIDLLLDAWQELPKALRDRYPLVLAGAGGWKNGPLREKISSAIHQGWLKDVGYVHESDLPSLYAGARVFIYPSLYEGFGLPPIEAMASNVPTIVANTSCLPEVTAGAAGLVDPQDTTTFAETVAQALEDEHWRMQAQLAGIAVASGYTWENCVAKTVSVYRTAVGR